MAGKRREFFSPESFTSKRIVGRCRVEALEASKGGGAHAGSLLRTQRRPGCQARGRGRGFRTGAQEYLGTTWGLKRTSALLL